MSDTDAEWIRLGGRRPYLTIRPLYECVVSLGLTEITPSALIAMLPEANIPHVKIGGKRYTRREWVAEWLESLKTTV